MTRMRQVCQKCGLGFFSALGIRPYDRARASGSGSDFPLPPVSALSRRTGLRVPLNTAR